MSYCEMPWGIFYYCFYITKFIVIISTCLPFWQRELSSKTNNVIPDTNILKLCL